MCICRPKLFYTFYTRSEKVTPKSKDACNGTIIYGMTFFVQGAMRGMGITMHTYHCRVVFSEAVDGCICFTRKIQNGGDWERSRPRPQGPKNVHNFLTTVRPLSWACGHGTEMLLILKNLFLTWLLHDIFPYDSPKKCPTILYEALGLT